MHPSRSAEDRRWHTAVVIRLIFTWLCVVINSSTNRSRCNLARSTVTRQILLSSAKVRGYRIPKCQENLYCAILYTMYGSKRSGMDRSTVFPANTPCLPFLRKRLPDGATRNSISRHPIVAYYSPTDPEGIKGWVGLVGRRIADGLPT